MTTSLYRQNPNFSTAELLLKGPHWLMWTNLFIDTVTALPVLAGGHHCFWINCCEVRPTN
jgi:hypothetical protein